MVIKELSLLFVRPSPLKLLMDGAKILHKMEICPEHFFFFFFFFC